MIENDASRIIIDDSRVTLQIVVSLMILEAPFTIALCFNTGHRAPCYETFYVRNLQIFVLSKSDC
jgi:hypothetical protein